MTYAARTLEEIRGMVVGRRMREELSQRLSRKSESDSCTRDEGSKRLSVTCFVPPPCTGLLLCRGVSRALDGLPPARAGVLVQSI